MRAMRRALGLAAVGRGAGVRGAGGGADGADGGRSEARGAHGHDGAGAAGADAVHQGPRVLGAGEGDGPGQAGPQRRRARGRPRPRRSTPTPSAGCSASRSTRTSSATARSSCTGARARPAPTARRATTVPLLGNRLDRFHWDGTRADLREDDPPRPRLPGGRDQPRPTRRPCRSSAATTTAASCAPARTARSTCRSATPAAAARRRTCSTARSARASPDDQFGGPDTVNDHLTGVILRLNPDGTTPRDNPFWKVGAERGGQVGANLKKIYAYGLRNGVRHGVRPVQRRPVGAGERRRLLQRDQPRRARLQLRLDAGHGPARARRPVQGDRDHPRPGPARPAGARPATTASSRSAGTRSTSPTPRGRPTTACSSSPARSSPTRR